MSDEYRTTAADLSLRAAHIAQTIQPVKRTPAELDSLMAKAARQKAIDDHLAPLKAHFKTFFLRSGSNGND